MGEHPDWLPAGWEIRVKNRNYGRKDKYYVNPCGLLFNSKPEVLRYLASSGKDPKPHDPNKVDISKALVLPHECGKEIVTKQKNGWTRKDPLLTHSLHLEKTKSEPDDRHRPLRAGSKKNINIAEENKIERRKRKVNDVEQREGGRRKSKRLAEINSNDTVSKDQSSRSGEENRTVENATETETNFPDRRGKAENGTKDSEHHQKDARVNTRQISESLRLRDLSPRTSKRLSDLSSKVPKVTVPRNEAKLVVDAYHNANMSISKMKPSDEMEIYTKMESTKSNEPQVQEPGKPPIEDLSSLEELKESVADHKEEEEDNKLKENVNSTLDSLLMDPCIEFAVKTLKGDIPIEEMKKINGSPVSSLASPINQTSSSSTMLPSGDIWTDPCFIFAVKILTSETPVDNRLQYQTPFDQPCSNGLNLPRIWSENYYPYNLPLSRVDDVNKPYSSQ